MMCSDKVRYYKAEGMIYVFNLNEKKAWKYGFKPFNKRVRFRPRYLYFSRHFYLFCTSDFKMRPYTVYLEMSELEWREFKIGDYL